MIELPHGTTVAIDGDALTWLDRAGEPLAMIDDELIAVRTPVGQARVVRLDEVHPVLGPVDAIVVDGFVEAARVGRIDWRDPARIPPVDRPGALGPGVGSALLDLVALSASLRRRTLRYRGPYPTAALWSTLGECFVASGTRAEFLAGAEAHALAGAEVEPAVDFAPAPFERLEVAPGIWAQLRDGLERAFVAGVGSFTADAPVRRIVRDPDSGWAAEVWLGDAPWATVARFAADGALRAGPHPLPAVTSAVLGQRFPAALAAALAEACADGEPALLAPAIRDVLTAVPIVWGDPGADAAIARDGAFVVHAAIWDRLAPQGLATVAAALAAALLEPARRLAQARLAQLSPAAG